MKIKTDSPIVKKAREGVMEFLLVSLPFLVMVKKRSADSHKTGKLIEIQTYTAVTRNSRQIVHIMHPICK